LNAIRALDLPTGLLTGDRRSKLNLRKPQVTLVFRMSSSSGNSPRAAQLAYEVTAAAVPLRDIGTILDVSFERVHQLTV
jgi:hypothetical protein